MFEACDHTDIHIIIKEKQGYLVLSANPEIKANYRVACNWDPEWLL